MINNSLYKDVVQYLTLTPNFPFTPDSESEVFFIDGGDESELSHFINDNWERISGAFQQKSWRLTLLKDVVNRDFSVEQLNYWFPHLHKEKPLSCSKNIITHIRQNLLEGELITPCFLHFTNYRIWDHQDNQRYKSYTFFPTYTCFSFLSPDVVPFDEQISYYIDHIYRYSDPGDCVRYRSAEGDSDSIADDNFGPITYQLMDEVRERIEKLRMLGVDQYLLRELIEEKPTLSRLVIDDEYRIFLPDYNNMEIVMSPLPKAVFFLFLMHPKGICFKDLPDYREKLLKIYMLITNRIAEEKILRSIQDVTDPTKNSINEKCARIKEAFLSRFTDKYAQNYYVTGFRGCPKRIDLPRKLVKWPDELKKMNVYGG